MPSTKSVLRDMLIERSVKLGDFTLASGRRSSYYIDARLTTMSGKGQLFVGEACWEMMTGAGWREAHFVGGLTMGADPIACAIASYVALRGGGRVDAFTIRKRPKGHGAGKRIEGGLHPSSFVVLVDDVITSGRSLLDAAETVRDHGAIVMGAVALIDREEGGRELLAGEGLLLQAVFTARELLQPG